MCTRAAFVLVTKNSYVCARGPSLFTETEAITLSTPAESNTNEVGRDQCGSMELIGSFTYGSRARRTTALSQTVNEQLASYAKVGLRLPRTCTAACLEMMCKTALISGGGQPGRR